MSEEIPEYVTHAADTVDEPPRYYHGPVERIIDRCPSCESRSMFVGKGGYLTCGCFGCREPGIGHAMQQLRRSLDSAIMRATSTENDLKHARETIAVLQDRAHFRDRMNRAELNEAREMYLTVSRVLREKRNPQPMSATAERDLRP